MSFKGPLAEQSFFAPTVSIKKKKRIIQALWNGDESDKRETSRNKMCMKTRVRTKWDEKKKNKRRRITPTLFQEIQVSIIDISFLNRVEDRLNEQIQQGRFNIILTARPCYASLYCKIR